MNSMWTSLLYLSCLLFLVQTSHGYFYKDNTVTDNVKQCFCEVNPSNPCPILSYRDWSWPKLNLTYVTWVSF